MSGGLVDIEIYGDSLEGVITDLLATPVQVERAFARALGKMAAWLRAKSISGLAGELAIPARVLRRRLRSFKLRRHKSSQTMTIWYGLDPIGFIYLGRPSKTATGLSIAGRDLPGAFVGRASNGRPQIFKRKGKSRLPLEIEKLDIEDKASIYIEDHLLGSAEFDAKFFDLFEHEMRWQTKTPR